MLSISVPKETAPLAPVKVVSSDQRKSWTNCFPGTGLPQNPWCDIVVFTRMTDAIGEHPGGVRVFRRPRVWAESTITEEAHEGSTIP